MAETGPIRFYFSFRSPYAWLAAERLEAEIGDLGVPIERIPVYPTGTLFPNDPAAMPDKLAYLVQDVRRLARERGLAVRFPSAAETNWAAAHAAYLGAEAEGAGQEFMIALFRQRFMEGREVGVDEVIAEAAEQAGLAPEVALDAAHDAALRDRAAAGWAEAIERDHVFGVPSFVYAGKLYWGQDRMHFLRSAVERKSGVTPSAGA